MIPSAMEAEASDQAIQCAPLLAHSVLTDLLEIGNEERGGRDVDAAEHAEVRIEQQTLHLTTASVSGSFLRQCRLSVRWKTLRD